METSNGRVSMPVHEWEKLTAKLDLVHDCAISLHALVDEIDGAAEAVAPSWFRQLRRLDGCLAALAAKLDFPF